MLPNMDHQEKYKNIDHQQMIQDIKNKDGRPDRGGCLSAFLALNIFANGLLLIVIIGAFFTIRSRGEYYFDSGTEMLIYAGFVILVGRFISAIGLWNWKKWGYQGLMLGFGITIVLGFLSGDMTDVVRSVIWGGFVYYMVQPIIHHLE